MNFKDTTMQITIKTIILFSLLFSSLLYADGGDKKVRLLNNVKEGAPKQITIKEIEKLGIVSQKVYNPYEKREDLYGGVLFDEFVKKYAKKDVKSVTLIAIDDYEVTVPRSEWTTKRMILSTRMNGEYIPIRSKGPLRIVYPDFNPKKEEYQVNLAFWIWMIKKIKFN